MAEKSSNEQTLQTYHGNCHCGAFRYSVKLPPLENVMQCKCSICSKKGYLWAFPLRNDVFVVEKGGGTLKSYEFANKTMAHKFCPTCGTPVMGQRHMEGPSIGVNVRTLHDIDLEPLKISNYDGAALEPAYQPPGGPKPANADKSLETYNGSCHCGKNADLWLYPTRDAVTVQGAEHLTYWSRYYKDKPEDSGHGFCSTCGVSVLNELGSLFAKGKFAGIQAINVRSINGLDLSGLKVKKIDGKNGGGEPYVLDAA